MVDNAKPQVFLFMSRLLGKKISDSKNNLIGRVKDLVATIVEPFPQVTHILVSAGPDHPASFVPWNRIVNIGDRLRVEKLDATDFREPILRNGELLLRDTLLDKQIVDTDGAKVRRVNDLQFLEARQSLHLVHVDVGFRGLMRRTGLERLMDLFLQKFFDYELPDQFISWKFVQPLASPQLLRLNITQSRLAQLHPADLADIIEDLDIHQRTAVFQSLDVETAAETLEETDPKIQVSLIEDLPPEDASDIIEEMSLSEAADLLGDLPKDKAEGILKEMEKESADDIKELLAHPEEKAGGLMTTSFLSFAPTLSAEKALEYIRREAEDIDHIYYLYVVDVEDHLLGVVGLRELLIAPPDACLEDLMDPRVVAVSLDEEKGEIAEHFAKYGMTAIPVVDDENRIEGVILFKNLLEIVAPELGK